MVTDITMIFKYFESGRLGFAHATLACVSLNLVLQSIMTYAFHKGRPVWEQVKEQLIVWSLLKQGVIAYRYTTSTDRKADFTQAGVVVDAQTEMTATRLVEMVCEAVPGTVIQVAAVYHTKNDGAAIVSLISSILSASFLSVVISWEYDTGKDNRWDKKNFYGYVPVRPRWRKGVIFLAMFFLSFFNLAVRSLACVMYSLRGNSMVMGVLASEILLYFFVKKVLMRDNYYWVPLYGFFGEWVVGLFAEGLIKVLSDWTAVVHFRCPSEVGGLYWTFSLGLTIVIGITSVFQHQPEDQGGNLGEEDKSAVWSKDEIIMGMFLGCGGMALSFFLFMVSIKRNFVWTFFSLVTSNEYIQEYFTMEGGDDHKFVIFEKNEHKWRTFIGEEVKKWVNDNIEMWLEATPFWFDDVRRGSIPDWIFEDEAMRERVKGGVGEATATA